MSLKSRMRVADPRFRKSIAQTYVVFVNVLTNLKTMEKECLNTRASFFTFKPCNGVSSLWKTCDPVSRPTNWLRSIVNTNFALVLTGK